MSTTWSKTKGKMDQLVCQYYTGIERPGHVFSELRIQKLIYLTICFTKNIYIDILMVDQGNIC